MEPSNMPRIHTEAEVEKEAREGKLREEKLYGKYLYILWRVSESDLSDPCKRLLMTQYRQRCKFRFHPFHKYRTAWFRIMDALPTFGDDLEHMVQNDYFASKMCLYRLEKPARWHAIINDCLEMLATGPASEDEEEDKVPAPVFPVSRRRKLNEYQSMLAYALCGEYTIYDFINRRSFRGFLQLHSDRLEAVAHSMLGDECRCPGHNWIGHGMREVNHELWEMNMFSVILRYLDAEVKEVFWEHIKVGGISPKSSHPIKKPDSDAASLSSGSSLGTAMTEISSKSSGKSSSKSGSSTSFWGKVVNLVTAMKDDPPQSDLGGEESSSSSSSSAAAAQTYSDLDPSMEFWAQIFESPFFIESMEEKRNEALQKLAWDVNNAKVRLKRLVSSDADLPRADQRPLPQ